MKKQDVGYLFAIKSKAGTDYKWTLTDGIFGIEQPKVSYADHSFVLDVLKRISGQMLTLVEASTQDKEQRKALKDVVKGFFSSEMNHVQSMMFSQEYNDEMCEMASGIAPEDLQVVDVEEIIRG